MLCGVRARVRAWVGVESDGSGLRAMGLTSQHIGPRACKCKVTTKVGE